MQVSSLADLLAGCEEGLQMAHDFLVSDVGCEEGGIYALGHVRSFLGFHQVPLREVLLELLQMLLVEQLYAFYVVFQCF